MKKIVSLILSVLLVLGVCLTTASCNLETVTGYTRLRDHMKEISPDVEPVIISGAQDSVKVAVAPEADGEISVQAMTSGGNNYFYSLELVLTNGTDDYEAVFAVSTYTVLGMSTLAEATAKIMGGHYTGEEDLVFAETDIPAVSEPSYRQIAAGLLNAMLLVLDTYCQKNASMSVDDLGFVALSDIYRYTPEDAAPEQDLGGAFSTERLALAGTMIVVGMGMVFLVLAILWGVLIIFKKVMYDGTGRKKEKATPVEKATPAAPAPDDEMVAAIAGAMAYAQDDGAIAAAITAAISEMIASDENLSREFAGGFRVVSFRKKSGKGAWNK